MDAHGQANQDDIYYHSQQLTHGGTVTSCQVYHMFHGQNAPESPLVDRRCVPLHRAGIRTETQAHARDAGGHDSVFRTRSAESQASSALPFVRYHGRSPALSLHGITLPTPKPAGFSPLAAHTDTLSGQVGDQSMLQFSLFLVRRGRPWALAPIMRQRLPPV